MGWLGLCLLSNKNTPRSSRLRSSFTRSGGRGISRVLRFPLVLDFLTSTLVSVRSSVRMLNASVILNHPSSTTAARSHTSVPLHPAAVHIPAGRGSWIVRCVGTSMDLSMEPMDASYRFIGSNGRSNGGFIGTVDRKILTLSMCLMRPALRAPQDFLLKSLCST